MEEIRLRKLELKYRANHQMRVIEDDLIYIKDHAGRLALSGLGELFFPALANRSEQKRKIPLLDYLSTFSGTGQMIANMMPTILGLLSPLLIRGMVKKVRSPRRRRDKK